MKTGDNLKVLFLTNIPSPYRVDFFNELGKYCDLTVVFEGEFATDRNSKWKGVSAENFKSLYLKGIRTGSDKFLCPGVLKVLSEKWDKIVVGMYSTPTAMLAIEYMRVKKIPFILNSDGGFIKPDNKLKHFIKHHFISAASAWLSTGEATTEYLVHYGADREKCFVYPFTSVRESEITEPILIEEKNQLKSKLGITEKLCIMSVGQFIPRKGFDVLIEACADLPRDIGVYIVGDEATQDYIVLKEKYNLENLHFIGFKAKNELAKYYMTADIFVLPTREDIWGLVVNEAMAYGLPVITTDKCIAGLEMIEDGVNGRIVSVENKELLKGAILNLYNDNQKMASMSENGLKIIKEYTIEKMARKHIEIMERK